MEVRVAQSGLRNAIHRWSGHNAAEGARCAKTLIIRHDQQDIWRAFRRHHARRPPGRRLGSLFLDHSTEFRVGRRKLFAVYGGGGSG